MIQVRFKKHDSHTLEMVKTEILSPGQAPATEVLELYVPEKLYPSGGLTRDQLAQINLRLKTQMGVSQEHQKFFNQLAEQNKFPFGTEHDILVLGRIANSFFKGRLKDFRQCNVVAARQKARELSEEQIFQALLEPVKLAHEKISQLVKLCPPPPTSRAAPLLDYATHLLVDFYTDALVDARQYAQGPGKSAKEYAPVYARLEKEIAVRIQAAYGWRQQCGQSVPDYHSPASRADFQFQLSALKKYFYRNLYIESEATTKRQDFLAQIGFSLAAIIAMALYLIVFMKLVQRGLGGATEITASVTVLLLLASLLYAIKDRLKETLRGRLATWLRQFYPYSTEFIPHFHTEQGVAVSLGKIQEAFSVQGQGVPEGFGDHYLEHPRYKKISLERVSLLSPTSEQGKMALKEIWRLNFAWMIPFMDDSEKLVPAFNEEGEIKLLSTVHQYKLPVRYTRYEGIRADAKKAISTLYLILSCNRLGLEEIVTETEDNPEKETEKPFRPKAAVN